MPEVFCALAKKYDPDKHGVIGWLVSEKLDGVRGRWCPKRKGFFSRSDKPLNVPQDWLDAFAPVEVELDGEFFMGRGRFQDCVSAVRKKNPTEQGFEGVEFVIFDSIGAGDHGTRLERATNIVWATGLNKRGMARILPHYVVTDIEAAGELYAKILSGGGEGLIFRNPRAGYERKRTGNLLKWKDQIDGTALVTGYDAGMGKHEGRVGALVCIDDETGVCFRVGTGLNDNEREVWQSVFDTYPESHKKIRWRAMERTRDNVPRHPVYAGIYNGE